MLLYSKWRTAAVWSPRIWLPSRSSTKNAAPVCSIDEPADGTSFEPTDAIVVKGTGSDEDGTIAKAVLKINDKAVESVATVPFEYTLTDEQKEPGNVKISLEVTDNYGKTATDEVTIVILGQFREFTDTRDGKNLQDRQDRRTDLVRRELRLPAAGDEAPPSIRPKRPVIMSTTTTATT